MLDWYLKHEILDIYKQGILKSYDKLKKCLLIDLWLYI